MKSISPRAFRFLFKVGVYLQRDLFESWTLNALRNILFLSSTYLILMDIYEKYRYNCLQEISLLITMFRKLVENMTLFRIESNIEKLWNAGNIENFKHNLRYNVLIFIKKHIELTIRFIATFFIFLSMLIFLFFHLKNKYGDLKIFNSNNSRSTVGCWMVKRITIIADGFDNLEFRSYSMKFEVSKR